MILRYTTFAVSSALALAGCSTMSGADGMTELARAPMIDTTGSSVGSVRLVDEGARRSMRVNLTGIAPGTHGFHLHTTGTCTTPDFQSAGGHLNPTNNEHGSLNPQGKHLGDLPNIEVGASGSVTTQVVLDQSRDDLMAALFDSDGTAVMVHSGADDYRTDPSGDAGSRIACGVLTRS